MIVPMVIVRSDFTHESALTDCFEGSVKMWFSNFSKAALILLTWTPYCLSAQETTPNEVLQDIEEVIHLINEIRSQGCYCGDTYHPPADALVWSEDLAKAADVHVRDMIVNGYFAHRSPDNKSAFSRVADITDSFRDIRENIARGQPSDIDVMMAWMESPGHCANIMQPQTTHVGLAVRTGAEVANSHGTTAPYWTMKLGKATREIDQKTSRALAAIPENKKGDLTCLELDRSALLDMLNNVRREGVSCDGDAGGEHTSRYEIHWNDKLEEVARDRAKILAETGEKPGHGDDRALKRTWMNGDGLRMAHYIYEKSSFDFEDALSAWLSDPSACRRIRANSITAAAVAAAVKGDSDTGVDVENAEAYWVFMFSIRTPESMKDEIVSGLAGSQITVYGRANCGKTRRLHRELEEFGIEHDYMPYESGEEREPNREKMHVASMGADRRIGNRNSLPYVMVGNNMYAGFSSAAVLYYAVRALE